MSDKVCENGSYRDMTPKEVAEQEARHQGTERQYWQTVSYDEAVNSEIRKRYSESQEFSLHRQKDEKPEEYAEYYAYCEACKRLVKEKKAAFETTATENG